jgi:ABC-type transport system involved in multi-copper enzyme maturation permease subunit
MRVAPLLPRLIRAEWLKMTRQRWVTGALLWVWPVGGAVLCVVIGLAALISPVTRQSIQQAPFRWVDVALGAWILPLNLFGRLLIIGYASRQFAGEYQWKTWKHSVPYAARLQLLAAKYLVLSALILLAFFALSVVLVIGAGLVNAAAGAGYPPAPSGPQIAQFLGNYAMEVTVTFVGVLIGAAFGALAAMLTRSIMGGIIGGLVFVLAELGFLTAVTTIGLLYGIPQIADMARFTSSHNIANISSWAIYGQPTPPLVAGARVNSPAESFFVLALWLVGLIGASAALFTRQDLE